MRLQTKLIVGLTLATAMVLSGCDCGGGPVTKKTYGEPFFEDVGGKRVPELTVDFGPVLLGTRAERKIKVINEGRGAFSLEQAVDGEGFDASFRYQFEPFTLDVGGTQEIPVVFEPTGEGAHTSTVTFMVSEGSITELKLTVTGLGVNGRCVVTPVDNLDFRSIAVGTTFIKQVKVSNSSDLEWKVTIGQIKSDVDQGAFRFSNFAPGEYVVPAHGELLVPVEFAPNHLGQHSAFLEIPAPAMCQPSVLPLTGNGVENVLECEPKITVTDPDTGAQKTVCRVDFGFVNPGTKSPKSVTFKNLGPTDLTVELPAGALIQPPGKADPYSIESTQTQYVVAKEGGTATVDLAFLPTMLGQQNGKLKFTSDDPKRQSDWIELAGVGGGPDIDVLPAKLDFGPVAVETYQFRRLTIANVGTDVSGTNDDNLKLVNDKGEEVRAELITDNAEDFSLEWPPQGYVATGIPAGQSVDLRVKFFPKSPGAKTATVRITSNDPDENPYDIVVNGTGQTMPPCDYEIVPPKLNYGTLENGKYRQMSFYIVNKASNPADECLVSTLGFARGTPDAFTLVKGPITGASIKGGESLEVPVRFAPKKDGSYTGAVEFYISSRTAPEGRVMLSGSSQAGCLMIAPNDLDFGVIQVNCSSRERDFTVYNVCPTTIKIDSIEIQTGLSNEFKITQKPVLPKTLNSGEQVVFKATYRPTDIGEDTGSFAIQTAQLPAPYVVTVAGRGATVAIQTDVFAQDAQPKVDVLIVVDDSCSMSDKQNSLGTNFGAFIKFAVSQQVDYHIAVTTTGIDQAHGGSNNNSNPPDSNGRFNPLSGSNPRILTPNTPNVQTVFAQNVKVGTSGNYDEILIRPAYLALSAPNLTGHNAGFLRDEAHLAIVVVSDAVDKDAVPLAFYQNFFLNLKGFNRANMFSFNGIIPTLSSSPSGCSYDESSAGQSTRVRELVNRTGGVYDEICTPDWAKTLEKIGRLAFGYRTRFFLSNVPDMTIPDPIVVKIDGQLYPQYGAFGDKRWSYNSTANAIDFEPLAVPEPGSTLEVSYHVACLP